MNDGLTARDQNREVRFAERLVRAPANRTWVRQQWRNFVVAKDRNDGAGGRLGS